MLKKETIWGATGATGPLVKSAAAVKNLLGAKMKIVSGYKGSASVKIAITRDEVHGICGLPMSTIMSAWADVYNSGEFRPVIQLSGRKQADLKGIPHVDDYAKSESDRQTYGLIFGTQALGRIYLSPPGTPDARRNALRAALLAAMKDPQFVADADEDPDRHLADDRRGGGAVHRPAVGGAACGDRAREAGGPRRLTLLVPTVKSIVGCADARIARAINIPLTQRSYIGNLLKRGQKNRRAKHVSALGPHPGRRGHRRLRHHQHIRRCARRS